MEDFLSVVLSVHEWVRAIVLTVIAVAIIRVLPLRVANALFMRRFRLAMLRAYIAFGDETTKLATLAPKIRRNLWSNWRRPRLNRRAELIESLIG